MEAKDGGGGGGAASTGKQKDDGVTLEHVVVAAAAGKSRDDLAVQDACGRKENVDADAAGKTKGDAAVEDERNKKDTVALDAVRGAAAVGETEEEDVRNTKVGDAALADVPDAFDALKTKDAVAAEKTEEDDARDTKVGDAALADVLDAFDALKTKDAVAAEKTEEDEARDTKVGDAVLADVLDAFDALKTKDAVAAEKTEEDDARDTKVGDAALADVPDAFDALKTKDAVTLNAVAAEKTEDDVDDNARARGADGARREVLVAGALGASALLCADKESGGATVDHESQRRRASDEDVKRDEDVDTMNGVRSKLNAGKPKKDVSDAFGNVVTGKMNDRGAVEKKGPALLHTVEELAASCCLQNTAALSLHLVSSGKSVGDDAPRAEESADVGVVVHVNSNAGVNTNSWGAGASDGELVCSGSKTGEVGNLVAALMARERELNDRVKLLEQNEKAAVMMRQREEEALNQLRAETAEKLQEMEWLHQSEEKLNKREMEMLQFEKNLIKKELQLLRTEMKINQMESNLLRIQKNLDEKERELKHTEENLNLKRSELEKREERLKINRNKTQIAYYAAKLGRTIGMENLSKLIGQDEGSNLLLPLIAPTAEEDWNKRHVLYDAIIMLFLPLVFCLQALFAAMQTPPSNTVQRVIFYLCGYVWMIAVFGGLLGLFGRWQKAQIVSTYIGRFAFLAFCVLQVWALWLLVPSSVGSNYAAGVLCGCVILSHIVSYVDLGKIGEILVDFFHSS